MPEYLAPGVYVEEVPSAVKPIAGVGTSTAGFVGVVPDTVSLGQVTNVAVGLGDGTAKVSQDGTPGVARVTSATAPPAGAPIRGDFTPQFSPAAAGDVRLCTSFSDFTAVFGSFSTDVGHSNLVNAVYGFF